MPILSHHQAFARTIPGATGESGIEVTFRRKADDTVITTAVADAEGFFQASLATTATSGASSFELAPGPYTASLTKNGVTRVHSSSAIGGAGPLNLAAQVQLNRALGSGLIQEPANGLATGAVTADGADRTVDVATFAAVIEGIAVWNDQVRALDIGANATGNTRIDTIVIEMVPAGQATEGKCTLKVVEGTTVAPTLTQDTTLWQFPLADVSVANAASTIIQGNITDRRDYVERSTTAVEADVADHETRITALEAGGAAVPRVDLVGYHQSVWDPASIPVGDFIIKTVTITFANDYTTMAGLTVHASFRHEGIDNTNGLFYQMGIVGDDELSFEVYNEGGSLASPTSDTLEVIVTRLVLS